MPPRRPTYRRMLSGAFRDSACATAIAGNKCPPVPPPEINTRMPDPSHLFGLSRNVDEYADRQQGDGQRGTTVTDKGQWHARGWERYGDGGDVHQRLERDPGGHATGEQRAEGIRRLEGDPIATVGKQTEEPEYRGGPDQPRFLTDDGENEVGVGEREPLVFLNALPQANAEDASRAERKHRLYRLEAGIERVGPGVEEGHNSMQAVGLHADEEVDTEPHDQREQEHMPFAATGDQELGKQDGGDDQGGAEGALQDHEQRDQA